MEGGHHTTNSFLARGRVSPSSKLVSVTIIVYLVNPHLCLPHRGLLRDAKYIISNLDSDQLSLHPWVGRRLPFSGTRLCVVIHTLLRFSYRDIVLEYGE